MTADPDVHVAFGDLCRSPWLIVYGYGLASEKLADEFAVQCEATRIRCRVCPIDDRVGIELHRYQGLVAILPTYSPDLKIPGALEPFAHLVTDYRARWGDGLAAVHTGKIPAYEAGPISLVGQRVLVHNPIMRSSLARACAVHLLDAGDPVDILRPFHPTSSFTAPDVPWARDGCGRDADGDDVVFGGLAGAWAYLRTWNITDPVDVPQLLQRLDWCRLFFENERLPQLYRPLRGLDRNRLDLILDGPDDTCGDVKTWNENGARVWRHVYHELRKLHPQLTRPGNANARGAQKDVRRLYQFLTIIDGWLQVSDGDIAHLTA